MPPTYERNNRHVDVWVPSIKGGDVVIWWIHIARGEEVVARAGEHQNKAEYMVPLFLSSDYSCQPTDPMPIWFNKLLQAKGRGYHTLAEAACVLDNPATFAEVECYHCHHKQYAELKADQCAIIAKLDTEDKHLSSICHCMEAWGLHSHLAHLENCLNLL